VRLKKNNGRTLEELATEQTNPASVDLDRKSALQIVRIMNGEDAKVAAAVKKALPQIARAIDVIVDCLQNKGRLIYVGTGTSGRIAALDAAECPPTFNTDPKTIQFIIAGGPKALGAAVESNEDSAELGEREMAKRRPGKNDAVVGIAASGRTPFTIAAVRYARRKGAKTVAVVCNRDSALEKTADTAIVIETGPEVISGSTRMKAGTAQKMVLNMLSSAALARLGYVYGNLMINVRPGNTKLGARAVKILERAADIPKSRAKKILKICRGRVPEALVMLQSGVSAVQAEKALKSAHGNVRQAISDASRKSNC
jgi:N-acetylmuramic acid 6-phosphate etherase